MILISPEMITQLASKAEDLIYDSESRSADVAIIENTIRRALIKQSELLFEKLVVVQPAVVPANQLLDLLKAY